MPTNWGRKKGEGNLFTSQCTNVSIYLAAFDKSFAVTDTNEEGVQYVSKFVKEDLATELVIREGGGYATTVNEKAEADKRLEQNSKRMDKLMGIRMKLMDQQRTKGAPGSKEEAPEGGEEGESGKRDSEEEIKQ